MAASIESLVEKLKLIKVEGVSKVALIRGKQEFIINEGLQIYYNPKTKTYVLSGEPRGSGMAESLQQYIKMMQAQLAAAGTTNPEGDAKVDTEPEGFTEEDIAAVMEQCNISRDEAIRHLNETGDVGSAVLAATMNNES